MHYFFILVRSMRWKVHCAFENSWLGSKSFSNFWSYICLRSSLSSSQSLSATAVCSSLQMRMISETWFQQWQALLGGGRTLVSPWGCVQVTLILSWLTTPTLLMTACENFSHCGWDRVTMYAPHSYTVLSRNYAPLLLIRFSFKYGGGGL